MRYLVNLLQLWNLKRATRRDMKEKARLDQAAAQKKRILEKEDEIEKLYRNKEFQVGGAVERSGGFSSGYIYWNNSRIGINATREGKSFFVEWSDVTRVILNERKLRKNEEMSVFVKVPDGEIRLIFSSVMSDGILSSYYEPPITAIESIFFYYAVMQDESVPTIPGIAKKIGLRLRL